MPSKAERHVSETAREREFYKCYVSDSRVPPPNNPPHLSSGAPILPHSSGDNALTAFAQLGALRLNARRALISLFSTSHEYVLAEATRTISLQEDSVHDTGDTLWLGNSVIPRSSSICGHLIHCQVVQDSLDHLNTPGVGISIIRDLTEDARYKDRPYVTGEPFHRFYAGVPIRTSKGIVIGVYCILDDKPREGFDSASQRFMKDMATTVMLHLEMARARKEYRRSEKMVRGIGSFVEGRSTLRDWWAGVGDRSQEPACLDNGEEGQLNAQQQGKQRQPAAIEPASEPIQSSTGVAPEGTRCENDLSDGNYPPFSHQPRKNSIHKMDGPRTPSPNNETQEASSVYTKSPTTPPHRPNLQADMLSKDIKETFSRAANIIRESIEVEGAIFFDASIGAFGGLVGNTSVNPGHPQGSDDGKGAGRNGSSSESDMRSAASADSDISATYSSHSRHKNKACGVLGFSTSDKSSINGDAEVENHFTVPEAFLKTLLRRYPCGKIFDFAEDGTISSSDTSSGEDGTSVTSQDIAVTEDIPDELFAKNRKKDTRRYSRQREAETVLKIFPGARCLALVPLWDSSRDRWFAGGAVWTHTPRRVFTVESELSYFAAFGSTIMGEVARLDTLAASLAKSATLGAISHELRSPLHGILGSVELVQESSINVFQGTLMHNIETCGRTLLDTIDHLLDYSKINNFVRSSKDRRKFATQNNRQATPGTNDVHASNGMMSLSSDVELDLLVEEVVDTVFAGYDFQRLTARRLENDRNRSDSSPRTAKPFDSTYAPDQFSGSQKTESSPDKKSNDVVITVDLDKGSDWIFNTQVGAWRRIVMNLFANSLKYTDRGFIKVNMKAKPLRSKQGVRQSKVTLSIVDSGRGIFKEYLRDRLFTPFAQEDQLLPGTGLGLSIVRQIVDSLEGKIDVQSVKGFGTQISVSAELPHAGQSSESYAQRQRGDFEATLERTKGLKVCLLGFVDDTGKQDGGRALVDSREIREAALKSSLQHLCTDWFGMRCTSLSDLGLEGADMYLINETEGSPARSKNNDVHGGRIRKILSTAGHRPPTAIVLRKTHSELSPLGDGNSQQIVESVFQPIGPRKLATALRLCLDRRSGHRQSKGSSQVGQEVVHSDPASSVERSSRPETSHFNNGSYEQVAGSEISLSPSSGLTRATEATSPELFQPGDDPLASPFASVLQQNGMDDPSISTTPQVHDTSTFLLVDDNSVNLQILVMYMKKNKHMYTTATNGSEAVEAYKAAPDRCKTVLMDVSMPIMDGLEATRAIRAFEHQARLKPANIIALTGLASASAQQEAFASGVNLFLTKPVRLKELSRVLEED